MSHALIWSEIDPTNLNSVLNKEIQAVGLGTNVAGTWTKKVYELKWINSSVSDVRLWLDNTFAEIYQGNSEFPTYVPKDLFNISNDLNFDFRAARLNNYNVNYLPYADVATDEAFQVIFAGGGGSIDDVHISMPAYVDGYKLNLNSRLLFWNLQTAYSPYYGSGTYAAESGLYKVVADYIDSAVIGYKTYFLHNILTAGRIVSVGNSSYFHYFDNLKPGETFNNNSSPNTRMKWVSRNNIYRLADVDVATVSDLYHTGSGFALSSNILDNYTLALNDRVLVKDQTDATKNGIYFVSDLYRSNINRLINPNTSTDTKDKFWDSVISNIYQDYPVSVQVGHGTTFGGRYYRFYKPEDSIVKSFLVQEDQGNDETTSSLGSTLQIQWTDATHFYLKYPNTVHWFYAVGATEGYFDDGVLYNMPTQITNYLGIATTTQAGENVLVRHANESYSGIWQIDSVGLGNTSQWSRPGLYSSDGVKPYIVKVQNSRSSVGNTGSQYWFHIKTEGYKLEPGEVPSIPGGNVTSRFILNYDGISVSERYVPFRYGDVSNIVTSEIDNFNRVNAKIFDRPGVGVTERVLVAGQATTASQNGIYYVAFSTFGSTQGLEFASTYELKNGLIFQDLDNSGSGKTYFLFTPENNVSAGTTSAKFVDMSNPTYINVDVTTSLDKITSGRYITPDDFSSDVSNSDIVLVNTSNKKINGIYDATLGQAEKSIFEYSDNLIEWIASIYRNVLSKKTQTKYLFSSNLKKETEGILIARNTSGFGILNVEIDLFGNLYVPEIEFPNTEESEKYFSEEYKGSALTQELKLNWAKQDYQTYFVKAVYNTNTIAGFPLSAGTAISNTLSNGSSLNNFNDILVYIGNGISSESNYNGIYRANLVNDGIDVYFTKHEEFDRSTEFESNSHYKLIGSPYERPTKVAITQGYLTSGSSFGYSTVYMQGILSQSPSTSQFGSTSITPFDENQYHAGIDFFIKNSNVRLSVDYSNLFNFPKIGPINHFIIGDLENRDTINGDILIVNRGYELFTNVSNTFNKYYYEIGDKVLYQDENEELFFTDDIKTINGLYVISYIDKTDWTYYLRRIKQNSSPGHIDHVKRLKIHSNNTLNDTLVNLSLYTGNGSTYYWENNNYGSYDVFLISENGTTTYLENVIDYIVFPEEGLFSPYGGFLDPQAEFYMYAYQNGTQRYNEVPKSLKNNYFNVDLVTKDKYVLNSGNAISSSNYTIDKNYFQLTYTSGSATTTDQKYNNDKIHWYKEFENNKNYFIEVKDVVQIGSTNSYFATNRRSSDGLYTKADTIFSSEYYTQNLIDSGTGLSQGLFKGTFYFDKINNTGNGITVINWYDQLNLSQNENILIISNNNSSIAETFQKSFYNDNNELVKHTKAGKQDQKILKFKELGYIPVTLELNTSFGSTLSPIIATSGINTYFLHYDPNFTNVTTDERSWYDLAGATKFEYDYEATSNISDLNDLQGSINGNIPATGNTVLLLNQTNTRENGLYNVVENKLFKLFRTYDLSVKQELYALGRVKYIDTDYELILPYSPIIFPDPLAIDQTPITNYTIGSTSGNTPLAWKKVGYGQTIDVEVATFGNFTGAALTSAFPNSIDEFNLFEDNKVLLLNQSDSTQRYVSRFNRIVNPVLTRVTESGSSNTAGFSITSCWVLDTNRNKEYEIYYSGASTSVGSTDNYWTERGSIDDYQSVDYVYDFYVSPDANELLSNPPPLGSKFIINIEPSTSSQTNKIYIFDFDILYRFLRDESLSKQNQFTLDKRVKVLNGNSFSGTYALIYDENSTFILNTSDLNWYQVPENYNLNDCIVATTDNIDLNSPPTTIDGVKLKSHDRILVKDQTDQTENGVYVVSDLANNVWNRSSDLNSSEKIFPQTTVRISSGTENSGKIYRIKLPFGNVGYDYQFYVLGTDNIEWIEVDGESTFFENPENWQKIGFGVTESFYLGNAKMDVYGISHSDKFAIAYKSPNSSKFSGNGITQNGKVRNLKFKVEYNTVED